MSCFQKTGPECGIESFYTRRRRKEDDCFGVDRVLPQCNFVFEPMGCFYHFWTCQKVQPYLVKNISNVAVEKERLMNSNVITYKNKVSLSLKKVNKKGGDCTRQPLLLNCRSQETFLWTFALNIPTFKRYKGRKIVCQFSWWTWSTWRLEKRFR